MCTGKFCQGCYDKQLRIDKLEERLKRVEAQLHYQERTALEKPFGASTPSSKQLVKANTAEEKEKRQGGAKPGHTGHGRKSVSWEEADEVIDVPAPERCPICGVELQGHGDTGRTVKDIPKLKVRTIDYRIHRGRCPRCGKTFKASRLPVLPRALLGNRLVAETATEHYVHGIPLGRLEEMWKINKGTMIRAFHMLRALLKPVMARLIEQYRQAPVKHADETGWRNNGHSGYAWFFGSPNVLIFCIRKTRSSEVPKEILGTDPLPGKLVVDRYNAYNKAPCEGIQYCYAHLGRDLEDMAAEFSQEEEVSAFTKTASEKIAAAIKLHSEPISDNEYYRKAQLLQAQIEEIMNHSAQFSAIQTFQGIFRTHRDRMYHWVTDRRVPADNNFAERELRPLVTARKVSFGSQSDDGAKTREVLMTALRTMDHRGLPVADRLKNALDLLAGNPNLDIYDLLFNDTS